MGISVDSEEVEVGCAGGSSCIMISSMASSSELPGSVSSSLMSSSKSTNRGRGSCKCRFCGGILLTLQICATCFWYCVVELLS